MKRFALALLLQSVSSVGMTAPIEEIIEKGGVGTYRCAYKGVERTAGCRVVVQIETVTHPELVAFNGLPVGSSLEAQTISITWPSGKISKFAWSDSRELVRISGSELWGYAPAFQSNAWPEIDWSRGFVIVREQSELVRLW